MGFDEIVRAGYALADTLTDTLQAVVQHHAWTGQDGFGDVTYAAPVARDAIVEHKQSLVQLSNGQTIMVQYKVSFLRPIPPNGASGRTEPIDSRDKIVLPNGLTGPIVSVSGLIDPTTTRPYGTEVMLG